MVEMGEEKDLESAQKDEKKIGKAASDPKTRGPARIFVRKQPK